MTAVLIIGLISNNVFNSEIPGIALAGHLIIKDHQFKSSDANTLVIDVN